MKRQCEGRAARVSSYRSRSLNYLRERGDIDHRGHAIPRFIVLNPPAERGRAAWPRHRTVDPDNPATFLRPSNYRNQWEAAQGPRKTMHRAFLRVFSDAFGARPPSGHPAPSAEHDRLSRISALSTKRGRWKNSTPKERGRGLHSFAVFAWQLVSSLD